MSAKMKKGHDQKRRRHPTFVVSALLIGAAVIGLAGLSTAAEKFTPAMQKVLAQAKKEGKVRFFVGSPRFPQSASDMLSKAFEEEFGFPLEVTLASLGAHPPVVHRLVEEGRMGIKPNADVFPTGAGLIHVLQLGGVVQKVDWAALGIPEKLISKESDGVLVRVNPRNVIYNTNLVKEVDVAQLRRWLDPKWKA